MNSLFNQLAHWFHFPIGSGDITQAQLQWLVRLRWLAVFLFFVLLLPGYQWGFLTRQTLPIAVGIIAFLFLFNLLTQLIFVDGKKPITSLFIGFQLNLDLLFLTGLLFLARGWANPFVGLFLLNASLGGILISGRRAWGFLLLTHALLAALQLHYLSTHTLELDDPPINIVVFHFLIFLFWLVMRSLGLYLEKLHLLQANQRIQTERLDRLRAVGALTAGFSHEFASPLNAAKIRLQRLSSLNPLENLTLSQHEDIAEALSAVEDCEVVIRQMNASQLDTRDFQLKSVNIKDFLLDVVGAWHEEHPKAQVQVEPVLDILVSIPTLHFAQVILNLLDNAFEAAPQKKINISFSVDAKNYIFSVLDQGSGFDPSVLQRLGEPFVTTKAFGTGLGLYVSQLFVQFLGGEIKIQNQQPLGAQVTLCWPLRGNV